MELFGFGKPSKARFGAILRKALAAAGVPGPLEFDEERFGIRYRDGNGFLDLHHAYQDYLQSSREQRTKIIEAYTQTALSGEIPRDFAEAQPNILPRVREAAYYPLIGLLDRIEGRPHVSPPTRAISSDLIVELCYDRPTSVTTLLSEDLEHWGIAFDELLGIAKANLWRIGDGSFHALRPGLHRSGWNDTHDVSRMLLTDLINDLDVEGEHVAFTPDRNHLIVTGSRDHEALIQAAEYAEGILMETSRPMTGRAHRLKCTRWLPFRLEEDELASRALRMLEVKSRMQDYAEQKARLDRIHDQEGTDVYVAPYMAGTDQDSGETLSRCLWTRDCDALIPRTDLIVFLESHGESFRTLGVGRWDRVAAVVRDLLEPTRHLPERYRVRSFPDAEQLDRMHLQDLHETPPSVEN